MRFVSSKLLVCALMAFSSVVWASAATEISVRQPHVRAVPPGQPNSAAFMQLVNSGQSDHAVVAARSPVANVVELHTHEVEGGMMKMRKIPQIDVPASSTTELKPGGLHVMLIDLKQGLPEDTMVKFTLVFEDGSEAEISAPVKKVEVHHEGGYHHR